MGDPSRMSLPTERQAHLFSLSLNTESHTPFPTLKTSGRATVAQYPAPSARRVPPSTLGPDKSVCSPSFASRTLTKSRAGVRAWFLRRSGCQDERHQSGQEEETLPHVPVHHLSGQPSPEERSGNCSHWEAERIFPARPCKLFPPAPPTGKTPELGSSPRKRRRRPRRAARLASGHSRRPPRCPQPEEGCRGALWEAWLAPPRRGLNAILWALFLPSPSGAWLAPSWPSAGGVLTRPSLSPLSPGNPGEGRWERMGRLSDGCGLHRDCNPL